MVKGLLVILGMVAFPAWNACALELPHLIGDGMVVQRDAPIPVWGNAAVGSQVRVSVDGETYRAESDSLGRWRLELPALPAGGPHSMTIEGDGASFEVSDIWAGDVWICSGQSNMEWPLSATENADKAVAEANDALIRHFKVPRSWAMSPSERLQGGEWQVASPELAGQFTAVGYYFAKRIRSEADVPIGLINSSWGGSNIESWMDAASMGIDPAENEASLRELEAKEAAEAEQVRRKFERWPGALSESPDEATADWSAASLDESDWVALDVPSLWEEKGFAWLDGVAWYRTSFDLTQEQTGQDLEIGLARIDDHDRTFVNGVLVGETGDYRVERRYTIDRELLRAGKNTVAVRVVDTGGGGGIYSDPELLFVRGGGVNLSLAGTWLFKVDRGIVTATADRNHTPTVLYNKMMHPLFNIPVRGVLWYQGEANAFEADAAFAYRDQFKTMIEDWRRKWNNAGLPFYWVQLANFNSGANTPESSPWAILRESQTQALDLPHTGQAVIIDVGDPDDIHPRDKHTVGDRLARHALKRVYGHSGVVADGPYAVAALAGNGAVTIEFKTSSELAAQMGETVKGFELASTDGSWHQATAVLDGKRVELSAEAVSRPRAVRYAWSDNPEQANLTDASGLPANPFRFEEIETVATP